MFIQLACLVCELVTLVLAVHTLRNESAIFWAYQIMGWLLLIPGLMLLGHQSCALVVTYLVFEVADLAMLAIHMVT